MYWKCVDVLFQPRSQLGFPTLLDWKALGTKRLILIFGSKRTQTMHVVQLVANCGKRKRTYQRPSYTASWSSTVQSLVVLWAYSAIGYLLCGFWFSSASVSILALKCSSRAVAGCFYKSRHPFFDCILRQRCFTNRECFMTNHSR